MKKKLLSLLLLAALLLSLFPFGALAEEPEAEDETENAEESRVGLGNVWGLPADDVLWFGIYKEQPVPWLVLDADQTNMGTEGVYLFSRDLIDKAQVRFDESSTLWEGSLAQEWCTNFAETAFTPAESELVPATDKYEAATFPNKLYGLTWRAVELKGEKVFFLSVIELDQYFGSYSQENKRTVKVCSKESYYWLRSPHYYHDDYHGMVLQDRTIHDYLPNSPWSARPCINLYVQDAIYVLPTADTGEPGAVPLPAEQDCHDWKLIVPQPESGFRAETTAAENGVLQVSYSGAETGENARLSLLIRDGEGKTLGLRRLTRPESAAGTLTLDTAELELPEDASLFLFCEQLNGENVSNYGSPLQELKTELPPPATPTPETPAPDAAAPTDRDAESGEAAEASEEALLPAGETEETPQAHQNTPKPAREETSAGREGEELKQKVIDYYPAIALGVFLLLAIALITAASYRHSLLPVILLVLLMLLTALVYLRLCNGRLPDRIFGVIQDLL